MNDSTTTLHLTLGQAAALRALCTRYHVAFDPADFTAAFDLPEGWVCGYVDGVFVGCSPEGRIHS